MKVRPAMAIPRTKLDTFLEILGWGLLLLLWLTVIYSYPFLPDMIPVHFNLKGEPDAYHYKYMLLSLPTFATIVFVLLSILNRYPHIFNYPFPITPQNALKQYRLANTLLRYIRLAVLIVFTLILMQVLETATGRFIELGKWLLPMTLLLFYFPIMGYLVIAMQKKNQQ